MVDYQKLLKKIYKETKKIKGGRNAHYIPELAKVNSNLFGISICDVKGNLFSIGDHNKKIAIESISKLFTLAFAIKNAEQKQFIIKLACMVLFYHLTLSLLLNYLLLILSIHF